MKMTPRIQKAINRSAELHKGQMRKCSDGLPYISHPYSVAWMLADYTNDENTIIGALMHDTIEDVKDYSFQLLTKEFGAEVAQIVRSVSEVEKHAGMSSIPWLKRKQKYLEHLEQADKAALYIAVADKIHNLSSMIESYQKHGDEIWHTFHAPKGQKLWFYKEVAKIASHRLNSPLTNKLNKLVKKAEEEFGE